jgi:hypothetical protein
MITTTMCANDGTDRIGFAVVADVVAAALEIEELATTGGPFWVSGALVGSA